MNLFATTTIFITIFTLSSALDVTCPSQCRCDNSRRKKVYCHERELREIPYGIPRETLNLQLQDNNITNGPRLNTELMRLEKLHTLNLHSNKLTSFPKRLPQTLEILSFHNNQIKFVGRSPLKGLTTLRELQLDGNSLTNQGLSPETFADTISLYLLELSDNKLTSIPEGLPDSLNYLYLRNNKINYVSKSSLERLTQLKVLRLSHNFISQGIIENGALLPLTGLNELDLSSNQLAEIPSNLPEKVSKTHKII